MQGTLFIVSTPIGNMGDITLRAIETLKTVQLIACEDTRRTKKLTNHHNINTPLLSFFEHNEIKRTHNIIERLKQGDSVALVSDAGTPGINDPGYKLINEAISNNIYVTAVPGASAITAALVISGLATDRFAFEGFLPNKSAARRKKLTLLKNETRTIVLYESPHRLLRCLNDMRDIFGDIYVVCAREITKKFEETQRGVLSFLIKHFSQTLPRGEFVVLFNLKKQNKGD